MVLSFIVGGTTAKGSLPEPLQLFSASRWGAEALFGVQAEPFEDIMQVAELSAPNLGYKLHRYPLDLTLMFLVGVFYRVLGFFAMCYADRRILFVSRRK